MGTQAVIGPATSQTAAGDHLLGSQAGSDLPAIHGGRDVYAEGSLLLVTFYLPYGVQETWQDFATTI